MTQPLRVMVVDDHAAFAESLREVLGRRAGLELTALEEHDSVPWDALPGQMTQIGGGEHRLTDRPERLPHSYTLQARRP